MKMKKSKLKENKYEGVSLADIFSKSKYGTYGNLKMKPLIITNCFEDKKEKIEERKDNKHTN